MSANHAAGMLKFARGLPEEDLLFLRVDITEPKVIDQWVSRLDEGLVTTIVASHEGAIVGYATDGRGGSARFA